jgi:hypothetical protein
MSKETSIKQKTQATRIGTPEWTADDLRAAIPEFLAVYEQRPMRDNPGGMGPVHSFLTWFVVRWLKPATIIESGIWKGAGTWILEQASPSAQLICIDPDLERIEYRSPRATYLKEDFDVSDWSGLDKETTVVFFDDHQNAFERVKSASFWGFKHLIFEDNYPKGVGDCYSLKKALEGGGHNPVPPRRSFERKLMDRLVRFLGGSRYSGRVPSNLGHRCALTSRVEVYEELPPVSHSESTRFGVPWEAIPCSEALFEHDPHSAPEIFSGAELGYTYLCYLKLKGKQ